MGLLSLVFYMIFMLLPCIALALRLQVESKQGLDLVKFLKNSNRFSLANVHSAQYYLRTRFGNEEREFLMAVDTESSWTWLPAVSCNCHESLRYELGKEDKGSEGSQGSQGNFVVRYTVGQVAGKAVQDVVKLKNFQFNLSFLAVEEEKDLFWMGTDGFIGLGIDGNMSHSVVTQLHENSFIKKQRFSIFFSKNEKEQPSELTFGSYDEGDYSDNEEIKINVTGSQWRSSFDSFNFSSLTVQQDLPVLFSPGFFGILGPSRYINLIYQEINKTHICESFILFLQCQESSFKLPSLNFTYNSHNISIPSESFTVKSNNSIIVLIGQHDKEHWVLGQSFFKDYYSVFDVHEKTVSIFKVSAKQGLSYLLYFIVGIFLVVVIFVPLMVYWMIDKPKEHSSMRIKSQNTEPLLPS